MKYIYARVFMEMSEFCNKSNVTKHVDTWVHNIVEHEVT